MPWPVAVDLWSEAGWKSAEERLHAYELELRQAGAAVARGGDCDRWDLEVRGGLLGTARLLMVIEEHGAGKQYVRLRLWPMAPPMTFVVACILAALGALAALNLEWTAWALLDIPAALLVGRTLYETASAMAVLKHVVSKPSESPETQKQKLSEPAAPPAGPETAAWQTQLKPAPPTG